VTERGVRLSFGDPKHYLLLAKRSFDNDARKDAAFHCRQAIESISNQLWSKLNKKLNISLTVKMRSPGTIPDLSTIVDSLTKEIRNISGSDGLYKDMKQLKEKYNWLLVNKGTHDQADLPEFERVDVLNLLNFVKNIEQAVLILSLEVKAQCP
jgi:hypothetical protein